MNTKKIHLYPLISPGHSVAVISFDLGFTLKGVSRIQGLLTSAERERADRIKDPGLRNRWVGSRARLRSLLARHCGCRTGDLRFSLNEWGKPSIASPSCYDRKLHFNFSHSGDVAVLAMSYLGPLGVDVERVRALADLGRVARRYFSSGELEKFEKSRDSRRAIEFFRIWTRKEAYLKALGIGLSGDLKGFEVSSAAAGSNLLLTIDGSKKAAQGWTLADVPTGRGYVAAIAIPHPVLSISSGPLWGLCPPPFSPEEHDANDARSR